MGLEYTLKAEQNHVGIEFKNAYWVVKEIKYLEGHAFGVLECYPNRELSKLEGQKLTDWESIPVGGPTHQFHRSRLWAWEFMFPLAEGFPNGIPLDDDAQKTAIYNWIKRNVEIPFRDVLE